MATDTWERIADGIEREIDALAITRNDRQLQTYQQTLPDERTAQWPAILLTFEGEAEQMEVAAFGPEFDVIYPVRVWIVDRHPTNDQTMRPTYKQWRKQIMDRLRPLTTLSDSGGDIPGVWDVQVQPLVAFDPRLPQYQYIVSGLLVRVFTRDS